MDGSILLPQLDLEQSGRSARERRAIHGWLDMGEQTNSARHHHAWVVFDHAHPVGMPPALLFA